MGLTRDEMEEMLTDHDDIDPEYFYRELEGNTGIVDKEHFITYTTDVLRAIRAGRNKRASHSWEWD